jgi:hypothetical protein
LPWRRFLHHWFGVFKQVTLLALLDFLEDVGMTVNVSENFTQRFRCDLIGVSPFDVDRPSTTSSFRTDNLVDHVLSNRRLVSW